MSIHDTMSGRDRSPRAVAFRGVTALLEPFYAAAVTARNKLYDWGVLRTHDVGLPVISVGNITTGGTGKTPMVIHVVKLLQQHGRQPAVILRGYKAETQGIGSDEAVMLREALPGVTVVTNPDRVAAARELEQRDDVDVLVLDDAFQHRRIARDLDVVLIDATEPFGYGHVLPRGMLREPVRGLRRADAVIVTHADQIGDEQRAKLDTLIEQRHGSPRSAHAAHAWSGVVDASDEPVDIADKPVFAVVAIGHPRAWMNEVEKRCRVASSILMPDHHAYTQEFADGLRASLDNTQAEAVLTTEKDWVKLRPLVESSPHPAPVWRQQMELQLRDGENAFERLILDAVQDHPRAASPST